MAIWRQKGTHQVYQGGPNGYRCLYKTAGTTIYILYNIVFDT